MDNWEPRRRPFTMSTKGLDSGLVDTPVCTRYSSGRSVQRSAFLGLGRERVDFGAADLLVGARSAAGHHES